jgi:zinc transport system substrate-binding protein
LVITTVFPLKEFAEAVGGDRTVVELLLPPGAEPHTWEPKPSDIVNLSRSDVFVYVSDEMEPWVRGITRSINNKNLRVLEAGQELSLGRRDQNTDEHHHSEHEGEAINYGDPHIWLDFSYDQIIVDTIGKVFAAVDPEGAGYYHKNAAAYKKKLSRLDAQYGQALNNCEHKEIILGSHAAFGLMAKRYGLRQVPLYGFSPDAEPTPRKMAEIITLARDHGAKVIYFEEFVSDKLARTIAREVGAKTLVLNPGANVTREQIDAGVTFLGLMEENLENLKNGLNCQQ